VLTLLLIDIAKGWVYHKNMFWMWQKLQSSKARKYRNLSIFVGVINIIFFTISVFLFADIRAYRFVSITLFVILLILQLVLNHISGKSEKEYKAQNNI
jgi:hypothetical protein